jgi:hypothetical protein
MFLRHVALFSTGYTVSHVGIFITAALRTSDRDPNPQHFPSTNYANACPSDVIKHHLNQLRPIREGTKNGGGGVEEISQVNHLPNANFLSVKCTWLYRNLCFTLWHLEECPQPKESSCTLYIKSMQINGAYLYGPLMKTARGEHKTLCVINKFRLYDERQVLIKPTKYNGLLFSLQSHSTSYIYIYIWINNI